MNSKQIHTVSMDDARHFAGAADFDVDRDLLVLEDFSRHDLSDKSLQLNFMSFCFCGGGTAHIRINTRDYEMSEGDLLITMGGQVVHLYGASGDFKAHSVLISRKYAQDGLAGLQHLWPYLLQIYQTPVVRLEAQERTALRETYTQLIRRMAYRRHIYWKETILQLMRTFFLDLCDILDQRTQGEPAGTRHNFSIFDRFIRLLAAHYKQQRSVEWYSRELCLTAKYLSEVVKSVSGKTAHEWISNLVLTEICMLLRQTDLSVKEIADMLHFPNQSFLGKYFKNATGVSPSAYRKQ